MEDARMSPLWLLVVAVSMTAMSACGSQISESQASSPSATSAPSATSTPSVVSSLPSAPVLGSRSVCRTSDLKISLVHTGAAAGTVAADLLFTNESDVPCKLAGWPAVIAVDATGSTGAMHLLTTEFGPTGIQLPPIVTLEPGRAAAAVLVGSDVYGSCGTGKPQTYRQLRVSPPGNSRGVDLSAWFPSLGRYMPKCGPLHVTPVVPEASIYGA